MTPSIATSPDDLKGKLYHPEDEDYLGFQYGGIFELICRGNVLLADEMGCGKTIQLIGYINATFRDVEATKGRHMKVLVICPNNLRLNWLNELDRWLDPAFGRDFEQCTTSAFFEADIVVSSFEGLTKWHRQLAKLPWDLIAVDEAHAFKNRSAKRTRALYYLTSVPEAALNDEDADLAELERAFAIKTKRVMMTGTPIPNFPIELFPLIHWLDPKQWPSAVAFKKRYSPYKNYSYNLDELQKLLRQGKTTQVGIEEKVEMEDAGTSDFECRHCGESFGLEESARNHAKANIGHYVRRDHGFVAKKHTKAILAPGMGIMIRRLKREVLPELPKKRRQIIELPAEGELLEIVLEEKKLWEKHANLQKAIDKALDELEGVQRVTEREVDFEAVIESLRAENRYAFEEIALIRHRLAQAKCPYVCDHIEEVLENKDKLVVFAHHRDVIEAIFERFHDRAVFVYGGMDIGEVYKRKDRFWNDRQVDLLIGSIKMTGTGLNLQVASNIVFAEADWVPGTITQAEDRCHRIGQDSKLLIQHLVAENSMDAYMMKKVIRKQRDIQMALDRPGKG
jgi:SWI/SNF-related matrix-associated actin-dependent regulator 1 of chromatin subfamily A